ncbi:hypothetical protein HKD37_12G033928 [Glycine soja]
MISLGSLLPMAGKPPKFAKLYIYNTKNEIENRIGGTRMAKERYDNFHTKNLNLQLIAYRTKDGRIYNLPTILEVAVVIFGDADIILEKHSGRLQRINEFDASYLGLQYPLLFPYGEDGYHNDIKHRDMDDSDQRKRNKLTIREFLCFRLQSRVGEEQLMFIRNHKKKLHYDKYNTLKNSQQADESQHVNCGKRIILPSSFVGSRSFTCYPYCPEIQRSILALNLTAQDRLDIVTRIFKLKLEQLMFDLCLTYHLAIAYIYTIEFQNRGLPHAYILLFLHPTNKYPSLLGIDTIISVGIPYAIEQP